MYPDLSGAPLSHEMLLQWNKHSPGRGRGFYPDLFGAIQTQGLTVTNHWVHNVVASGINQLKAPMDPKPLEEVGAPISEEMLPLLTRLWEPRAQISQSTREIPIHSC